MWKKNRIASSLLSLFFIISIIEIVAEFYEDKMLLWASKPLLIPVLTAFYIKKSKRVNNLFIIALFFSWVANIIFIEKKFNFVIAGSIFFLIYKIIIIYLVTSKIKFPNIYPALIGALPFIFLYVVISFFTFPIMGKNIYIFLIHGFFSIVLGAISLGNYFLLPNKVNFNLFISSMLFAVTQFLFVLNYYSENTGLYHSLSMVLYVFGQLLLVKFMFLTEKYKNKYEIVNYLKEPTNS
ncbi:MAG: lysoplasmalogenase family protein [Flavobacteriaceae bacterium]